ncbi:MAG: Type 1 glutamine amidotransferase-like domain-containing protein [Actinobacteria bacterium]|nr:Type 1 glutamine amidotransferase-like domain-containing protein [Actinomycetota bacterium]
MTEPVLAFLGSGEFDPWSDPIDRWLVARSRNPDGPVLISPAAAAHEGDATFDMWANKGLDHYRSLGIPAEVLPLKTRDDATDERLARRLDDASMIFFSGGNPARLAAILDGTPFWLALTRAMREQLPYAGCSAGVACLTETTYDSDTTDTDSIWAPGLGHVRDTLFAPHWDIVETWVPGATEFIVGSVRPGQAFVGLDEETAIVGDGARWEVVGRSKIHVLRDGMWATFADGDTFELALPMGDGSP